MKEALCLARVEEAKIEAWIKRSRTALRNQRVITNVNKLSGAAVGVQRSHMSRGTNGIGHNYSTVNLGAGLSETKKSLPIKNLTRDQISEKGRKGLYFSCDETYVPGRV